MQKEREQAAKEAEEQEERHEAVTTGILDRREEGRGGK